MKTKIGATFVALMALLAFTAGPASAQETETDSGEMGAIRSAAARAESAAGDFEDGKTEVGLENASAALQSALANVSADGAAGQVLSALLAGQSPASIGVAFGDEMAAAAAERAPENPGAPEGVGEPENPGAPDGAGQPDGAGAPTGGGGRP